MAENLPVSDLFQRADERSLDDLPAGGQASDPEGDREEADRPESSEALDEFRSEVVASLAQHIFDAKPGMLWPPPPSTGIYGDIPLWLRNDVWLALQELCQQKRFLLRRQRQDRIVADRIAGRLTS